MHGQMGGKLKDYAANKHLSMFAMRSSCLRLFVLCRALSSFLLLPSRLYCSTFLLLRIVQLKIRVVAYSVAAAAVRSSYNFPCIILNHFPFSDSDR